MQDPDVAHVFLLAGQSNMAGRGGVVPHADGFGKYFDVAARAAVDAVACPCNVTRWSAAGQWEPAQEPMHKDIDTGCAQRAMELRLRRNARHMRGWCTRKRYARLPTSMQGSDAYAVQTALFHHTLSEMVSATT